MPIELRHDENPFASPVKTRATLAPRTTPDARTQQPDVLATADLLLEQLRELENLCSTVEERVQRKRQALKELEYLIRLGTNNEEGSPRSPVCPANTPIGSRLRLVSPRLRGLFDLRGPGQANLDATQSCLDYSPESQVEDDASTREDPGHSDEWVDDDEEEALLSGSPFDDKYALQLIPRKVEKMLPATPRDGGGEVVESKIPRKIHVRRQASTLRRVTSRSPSAVARNTSHRRRPSVRSVKATDVALQLKGTMRRGSWKRSLLENAKTKGGAKAIENETRKVRDGARRKEKKKGLWSIYSVCSELGLPRAI